MTKRDAYVTFIHSEDYPETVGDYEDVYREEETSNRTIDEISQTIYKRI